MSLRSTIKLQPMKKRSRISARALWLLLVLVLMGAAGYYWGLGPGKVQAGGLPTNQPGGASTKTVTVEPGSIKVTVSGSGTLAAASSVDLSFPTNGTVVELNVQEGDFVKTGDILAKLSGDENLKANLASLELEYLKAQISLEELQNGAGVALAQAYQTLLEKKETYEDAVAENERVNGRRCSRESTQRYSEALERAEERFSELAGADGSTDTWVNAKADYDTALANFTYCASYSESEKTEADAAVTLAEAEYQDADSAYNKLVSGAGIDSDELQVAETTLEKLAAEIEEARADLEGMTIVAPIDGRVVSLAAGEGEMVSTDPFITIADVSQLVIETSVDANDVVSLSVGKPVEVTFDALPNQIFYGTLTQISPTLSTSGMYSLVQSEVLLDSASTQALQNLPIGLNAGVAVITEEAQGVLVVPLTALKNLGGGKYAVMIVGADGQLSQVDVEVGMVNDSNAEIRSGVSEGAVVSALVAQDISADGENGSFQMMPGGMPPDGGGFEIRMAP